MYVDTDLYIDQIRKISMATAQATQPLLADQPQNKPQHAAGGQPTTQQQTVESGSQLAAAQEPGASLPTLPTQQDQAQVPLSPQHATASGVQATFIPPLSTPVAAAPSWYQATPYFPAWTPGRAHRRMRP